MTQQKTRRHTWSPNEYSPTYVFETDGQGNFVRLLEVWDLEDIWPQRTRIDHWQDFSKYFTEHGGFDKFREHRRYFNDPEFLP